MSVWQHKGLRFVAVGLTVTLIDLGVTYLLVLLTGTRLIPVTAGYISGLVASYLLHAKITFSVNLAPGMQIPRFLTLVVLNYLQTIAVVLMSTEALNLSTMAGKFLSLPIIATTTYFCSKYWVYRASNT
jgi:putative flippase GtrA